MMRKLSSTKQVLLGFFVIASVMGIVIYPLSAAAIGLKENSIVTKDTITLGDIFTGLPGNADKVMGIAPQPGHEMVLDSRTLLRIALSVGLPWRPETSTETVVLKRAGTVVDQASIETALKNSLTSNGITGQYKLVLSEDTSAMILPPDVAPSVEVTKLDVKQDKNWFEATLIAPSKEKVLATKRISGRIEFIEKIPVLRESLNSGAIIGANDIDYIEIPQKNVKAGIVLKAEDVIGATPRRMLVAGQMISENDIQAPRLVERGEIVTMVFSLNGLQLTAQGKALEHGAKGEQVRVINTASNKTIVAEVTSDNEVTVKTF